ncbi:MAG: YdcF family protein [Oscillospiraceae bacterium]|nr:YdcF family protein [Oscillospiraceae bacterium]
MSRTRSPKKSAKGTGSKPRRPKWRVILTCLALGQFTVFFLPVFGGILNIANVGAMGGSLLEAGVFWWWPGFLRLLGRLWRRTWGKLLLLGSGLGLLLLGSLTLVFCWKVCSALKAAPEAECPTVIVLGCQVRGTRPSLLLAYRIQTAGDYLEAHPQAVAVLSGGQGWDEGISEAECMYRELTRRGIDPARLYREDQSTSTRENLAFSRTLMEREGLTGPTAVVSNDFHVYRAVQMAQDQGLEAHGLAAPCSWYSRPTYILREALALTAYFLANP